jgi:hypothetical protein
MLMLARLTYTAHYVPGMATKELLMLLRPWRQRSQEKRILVNFAQICSIMN